MRTLVALALVCAVVAIAPAAAAGPPPLPLPDPPPCIDIYREYSVGPVTVIQRGCQFEVHVT